MQISNLEKKSVFSEMFNTYFKPSIVTYLKAKKGEMEDVGVEPTLENLINELEPDNW